MLPSCRDICSTGQASKVKKFILKLRYDFLVVTSMVHTFRITDNLLSPHSERIVVFRSFNCTGFRGEGGIELELPFPAHGQFILVDDLHNFFPSHAFLCRRRKKALIRVRNRRDFENGV